MRLSDEKVIEFNEDDAPADLRQAIIDRIDEKPSVHLAFLERAFETSAGEKEPINALRHTITKFMERYGIVLLALPTGLYRFVRAAALAGFQFKVEALPEDIATPNASAQPLLQPTAVGATPANMRQQIIDRIDERPVVWSAYLEKAFSPFDSEQVAAGRVVGLSIPPPLTTDYFQKIGETISQRVDKFCEENGFAWLALPNGQYQFFRAEYLASLTWTKPAGATEAAPRILSPLEQIIQKAAERVGLTLPVELLDAARIIAEEAEADALRLHDPKASDKALLENFWNGVRLQVQTKKFARTKTALLRSLHSLATGLELDSVSAVEAVAAHRGFSVVFRRSEDSFIFRKIFPQVENVERASGEVTCADCGFILYDHPEGASGAGVRIDCAGRGWKV